MDELLLAKLCGIPPTDLEDAVELALTKALETLQQQLGRELRRPHVTYDLKGTTAGYAIGDRKNQVRLNLDLLLDPRYTDEMLKNTLPHEVAHIAVMQLYPGSKSHGREWKLMMSLLGLPAKRCHNYDVSKARQTQTFTYYCKCGPKELGKTRHNRVVKGIQTYYCTVCGEVVKETPYS